jgi:hypothetical protein
MGPSIQDSRSVCVGSGFVDARAVEGAGAADGGVPPTRDECLSFPSHEPECASQPILMREVSIVRRAGAYGDNWASRVGMMCDLGPAALAHYLRLVWTAAQQPADYTPADVTPTALRAFVTPFHPMERRDRLSLLMHRNCHTMMHVHPAGSNLYQSPTGLAGVHTFQYVRWTRHMRAQRLGSFPKSHALGAVVGVSTLLRPSAA